MELSLGDFQLLRDLVYERTGLRFEDKKRSFVGIRLARRMEKLKYSTASAYYQHLQTRDLDGSEFQAFVEELTTNETYFFRDYPQLETFANDILPPLAEQKRAENDYTLNIWSAACSTGDEPYTLAIILASCLDDFRKWKIRLLGTDIDSEVLKTARAAVYSERNVKDVPTVYLNEYFIRSRGEYRVIDAIRKMVTFEQVNFMDPDRMQKFRGFDVILCRNVLIYFDDASRKKVLSHFHDALHPGGYVFLGHAESVGRITQAFQAVSINRAIVYRKPVQGVKPVLVGRKS